MKRLYFVFTVFILFISCTEDIVHREKVEILLSAGNKINSTPLVLDGKLFMGSDDGMLYCLNLHSGKIKWQFDAGIHIRSNPVSHDSILFFAAGNSIWALQIDSGEIIWKFSCPDDRGAAIFDYWDYHHSSPVIEGRSVFIGFGDGTLWGFDILTGEIKFHFTSSDSSAIRSTPVIRDSIIYFGDWDGRAYAVDMKTLNTLWIHSTYDTQPYPTFGQLNTSFAIIDSLVVFGARNPELRLIHFETGELLWSHIENDGGWISGDPLISGDTLFIGGSDCHKMYAFKVHTGELLWEYEFLFNHISQPLSSGNYILFTSGDAYAITESNRGYGYLYALDKNNGSLINFELIGGNIFTAPIIFDKTIFIGSEDNNVYSISLESFVSDTPDLNEKGYGSFDLGEANPNPFTDSVEVTFTVNNDSRIHQRILSFGGEELKIFPEASLTQGTHEIIWNGTTQNDSIVSSGYYILELRSGIFIKTMILIKQ